MAMIRLYVVRHGIALDGAEWQGSDGARALSAKGRKRFKRTAKVFARLGEEVDLLFTSPLVRAVQTSELLARALGLREVRVLEELLPGGEASAVLTAVSRQLESGEGVAIVGHDPLLTHLVTRLSGLPEAAARGLLMAKGAIVRIDVPVPPAATGAVARWTLWPKEKSPEAGPPLEKTEEERTQARAQQEERAAALKAERRVAREKKRTEKKVERAKKKRAAAALREAKRPARKRAVAKRGKRPAERASTPPVGAPKGPDPKKRVAKPRRSVSARAPLVPPRRPKPTPPATAPEAKSMAKGPVPVAKAVPAKATDPAALATATHPAAAAKDVRPDRGATQRVPPLNGPSVEPAVTLTPAPVAPAAPAPASVLAKVPSGNDAIASSDAPKA